MKNTAGIDIADLCAYADLEATNYQQFRGHYVRQDAASGNSETPKPEATPQIDPSAERLPVNRAAAPSAAPANPPLTPPRPSAAQPASVPGGPKWHSLRAVLQGNFLPSVDREEFHQKPGLIVERSSSGCGATTILATTARILSTRQERPVVIDNASDSLLPMHFGARSLRNGASTFYVNEGKGAARVHILTPSPDALRHSAGGSAAPLADAWVERGLSSISGDYNRLFIKAWPGLGLGCSSPVLQGMTWLIPIVPDVRSTLRLQQTLDRLAGMIAESGDAPLPYFVLNRFDENVALHNELRKWLKQRLNGQLLPFVIRRSDEVDEALAEGLTVVDYAPGSAVTEDFHRLAEWVHTLPAVPGL